MQNNTIPMQRLDAYVVAKEIAKRVHEAKIRDNELRDQATRAAKSCFLTLCEGLPNDGVALDVRLRRAPACRGDLYGCRGFHRLAPCDRECPRLIGTRDASCALRAVETSAFCSASLDLLIPSLECSP